LQDPVSGEGHHRAKKRPAATAAKTDERARLVHRQGCDIAAIGGPHGNAKRKAVEDVEATNARLQHTGERDAKRRDRPLGSWDFMVAGSIYEGRPNLIRKFAVAGDRAYLVRVERTALVVMLWKFG
jgi:hypothetical protein